MKDKIILAIAFVEFNFVSAVVLVAIDKFALWQFSSDISAYTNCIAMISGAVIPVFLLYLRE